MFTGGSGECADVLTCGMCQKDFLLADILRFIQHKVTCQASGGVPCKTEGITPLNNAENDSVHNNNTIRDFNGDLNHQDTIDPGSNSPRNLSSDGEDCKIEEKRKRDEEDDLNASARKKPRSTQDAEANTVDSGE